MTANANGFNAPEPYYNGFGNPDLSPNSLSPRILPTYDPTVSFPDPLNQGQPTAGFLPTAQFLQQFPRLASKATVTFGGTVTAGDTCFVNVYSGLFLGGVVQVSTMALTGDTLPSIAERLLGMLNANPVMAMFGIRASLDSTNEILSLSWPGPVGNFATIQGWSYANTETITVGGSETDGDVLTVTLASASLPMNAAQFTVGGTPKTGDVVAITFENQSLAGGDEQVTYTVQGGDTLANIATGLDTAIGADSALASLGLTHNAAGAKISVMWNGQIGPVYVSTSVSRAASETLAFVANGGVQPSALAPSAPQTETITVGGSASTGDVLEILFYAPTFRPPITIQYIVQGGDTLSSIAAALNAAINANAQLAGSLVTSTVLAAALTVTWFPLVSGLLTFGSSVKGIATETLGWVVAPTSLSVSVTTSGSESLASIATALSAALNADSILAGAGVVATHASDVVTVDTPGALALVTFSDALSVGATETLTFANTSTAETLTITGGDTAGDVLSLLVHNPILPTGLVTLSHTVTNVDTDTTIAAAFVALISGSGALQAMGFNASNASSPVVTMTWSGNAGPVTFTTAHSGGASETLTLGGSFHGSETFTMSQFAGGSGPVIPLTTIDYSTMSSLPGIDSAGSMQTLVKGVPVELDYSNIAALVRDGAAII